MSFDFWQLLAGLAIFLYGMSVLEDALKQLAGRTFKLFLRKHTNNPIEAVLSSTVVTGVLQSSSVVTFMALSFVGAGVISMRNALAVVFGSNLGTTLDSWVMATLGFKFDIENFSFPLIALAGAGLLVFAKYKKLFQISRFMLAFGLSFLGLALMKNSIGYLLLNFTFPDHIHQSIAAYILVGFIITAIIQSSSATMVITLSAVNSGALPFEFAVAIITGSELGTALKILISSMGGIAAKRRVAFGNIIFNTAITVFGYFFIYPIIALIHFVIGTNEPLIGLVMFQSIINLFGILLFLPLLGRLTEFLEKRFTDFEENSTRFIENANPSYPEAAVEDMEKETLYFINRVIHLNLQAFKVDEITFIKDPEINSHIERTDRKLTSFIARYDHIKKAEGEILLFYTKMLEVPTEKEDFNRLNQLISAVRNAMYSAKGIKDIYHDRKDLNESANDVKYEQYQLLQEQLRTFYKKLVQTLEIKNQQECFNNLIELMQEIRTDYEKRVGAIYAQSSKNSFKEIEISTLLNVSREIYSSCKAIIFSLKDFRLGPTLATEFENKPLSI